MGRGFFVLVGAGPTDLAVVGATDMSGLSEDLFNAQRDPNDPSNVKLARDVSKAERVRITEPT